jgi:hypothetical protein
MPLGMAYFSTTAIGNRHGGTISQQRVCMADFRPSSIDNAGYVHDLLLLFEMEILNVSCNSLFFHFLLLSLFPFLCVYFQCYSDS